MAARNESTESRNESAQSKSTESKDQSAESRSASKAEGDLGSTKSESAESRTASKAEDDKGSANAESPTPKPTTNKAEAEAAERSAERDDSDPNAQTGGTAGARKGSETKAGVAEGDGYIENPDFIPNPADHYGTLDTSGAGSREDKTLVNPSLVKDETVAETLPEADRERVTKLAPDYAKDGSRIVRPDSV